MNFHRLKGAFLGALFVLPSASAYTAENTAQMIFSDTFRTLHTDVDGNLMSVPIIRLGTDDRLNISFDEIGDDFRYLQYRLVHCNADWQPSQLVESEYLPGFNIGEIDDYAFSSNTFVHFVNYHLTIPQEGMEPMVSGNYLLQVFDQEEPDEVLLQVRFGVSENTVGVDGRASGRTDRGFNTEWQQIDLTLRPGGFRIQNPYQDLTVTVSQNQTPWTLRTVSHPMRVQGEDIVFEHDRNLIYPGSNEFRRFEMTRVGETGMHVDSVRFGGTNYHIYLTPDTGRGDSEYYYDSTQKGRYLVRESNASDSDLGADYMTVHFTLDFPEIIDANIYVDGEMTGHRLTERNRMHYDRDAGVYRLELPLKQGAYNYRYVVARREGNGMPTPSPVEGDFYETRNEYLVQVYYRPVGARADRLIGYQIIDM